MSVRTFEISLGKAQESNDFGAEASLRIPWDGLLEAQQEVLVTLFVDHDFMDTLPVCLTLQVVAHRAINNEDSSSEATELVPRNIEYYPPATHPIPLTIKDLQTGHLDETLNKVNDGLLEKFVNTTVESTTCTLSFDDTTGELIARLRWKQSGDLIVETVFYR